MSREGRVVISRIIVVLIFMCSILAAVLGSFFTTLIAVSGGLIVWLLYLLAADLGTTQEQGAAGTSLGKHVSGVIAGLGVILAISSFRTYGLEQNIHGGYIFNLAGIALAIAILAVMLLPLVLLLLTEKPKPGVLPSAEKPAPSAPEPTPPPAPPAMPEPYLYYGTPYPGSPYAVPEEEIEYDEDEEEWEEGDEEGEEYYTDEEDYEYYYEDEEEPEEDDEDEV